MAIEIVDETAKKTAPAPAQETSLSGENREEKVKRLQWILQQMIREAVRENNQELCRELKESMVKESEIWKKVIRIIKIRQKKRKGISFSEMPFPGRVLSQELILCDSTNGALTCAGTATDALICIDFELSVAHADSANGALCLTSSTCYTSITNNKCHNLFLLFCVYQIILFDTNLSI